MTRTTYKERTGKNTVVAQLTFFFDGFINNDRVYLSHRSYAGIKITDSWAISAGNGGNKASKRRGHGRFTHRNRDL